MFHDGMTVDSSVFVDDSPIAFYGGAPVNLFNFTNYVWSGSAPSSAFLRARIANSLTTLWAVAQCICPT
jgi:hypothetical protein